MTEGMWAMGLQIQLREQVKLMLFNKNLFVFICGDWEGKRGSLSFVCHEVKPASAEPV